MVVIRVVQGAYRNYCRSPFQRLQSYNTVLPIITAAYSYSINSIVVAEIYQPSLSVDPSKLQITLAVCRLSPKVLPTVSGYNLRLQTWEKRDA